MKLKRWMPAIIAPTVVAGFLVLTPLQANAIDLPDLTPQQVLELAQNSDVTAFSGVVLKKTELGLPELEMSSMVDQQTIDEMSKDLPEEFAELIPQVLEQNLLTQAIELISGSHTFRVYAADEKLRVQVLDRMSQRELVIGESTIWAYDFRSNSAWQLEIDRDQLSADAEEAEAELIKYLSEMQVDLATPQELTEQLLAKIDEGASISVGVDHRVAGRGSYQLVITPDESSTTVDYATISVDAETGLGLQAQVFAKGQPEAAVSVGFETIDFSTPDASLFEYSAPEGASVIDVQELLESYEPPAMPKDLAEKFASTPKDIESLRAEFEALENRPEVLGADWESVLHLKGAADELPMDLLENELFAELLIQVEGGRVFSTPLVNLLITDGGDVYVGAVTIEHLVAVSR